MIHKWKIVHGNVGDQHPLFIVPEDADDALFRTSGDGMRLWNDEATRLAGCAPELLAALKDLVRLTEHICQTTGYNAKLDMHHAAIAKAEGR